MSQEFDQLLKEYENKLKQSNEINNDLNELSKKINKYLLNGNNNNNKDNLVKLEAIRKKYIGTNGDIVDFNVGGSLFSICKSNICKKIVKPNTKGSEYYEQNLLQSLVNGEIETKYDKNKVIFIDRDPKYFGYVLNYLRAANTSEKFEYPNKNHVIDGLLKEATYFHMQGLADLFSCFNGSSILNPNQSQSLIKLCEFHLKDKWSLIYKGSSHGFSANSFHSKCDGVKNTLTIIKTTQSCIFGGFTQIAWDSSGQSKLDPNAFIFSLYNKDNKPIKMMYDSNSSSYSIQCYSTFGPTFGGGYDFHIADNANLNTISFSNLGHTYKHPFYLNNSDEAKSFLGGSFNFQLSEIEVYTKQ